MKCTKCGAEYTLSVADLNVMAIFKCFACDQHNLYVAGHVLELDQHIMIEGTNDEKRRHIVETVQLFACEFAGNVINNVDRVINVNVEADLPETDRRGKKRRKKKRAETPELSGQRLYPSRVRLDAPEISRQEVRDFASIDVHLIDRKEYFEKFFGGKKS
jgi:hypothetical protein